MFPQSDNRTIDVMAEDPEYSESERELLLKLAHQSIDNALRGEEEMDVTPPSMHLAEQRGAFTTLHLDGKLRGCIGYLSPLRSLFQTVVETARAAAFDDPRFPPVTPEEAAELKIEISVLSPLHPISPEEIVVGKHGLVVTMAHHRGLLLPQVPVEWAWDRETFLAQTCLKAGLPSLAWQQGAQLQAFTAEVFGEQ